MLGFVFGRHPNANAHIDYVKKKFFAKLWILRHLSKANISKDGQDGMGSAEKCGLVAGS